MKTLYVYDNALLSDNGIDFNDTSCVAVITCDCDTGEKCLAEFEAEYGSNEYSASFTKH